jgi:hypothetical protein
VVFFSSCQASATNWVDCLHHRVTDGNLAVQEVFALADFS